MNNVSDRQGKAKRPFDRPLQFGDAAQAAAVAAMNGDNLYCPDCFYVPDDCETRFFVGHRCHRCGRGRYVRGELATRKRAARCEPVAGAAAE